MRNWTDNDIEALIQDSVFPNPVHKAALRERLFESTAELGPDDLDYVAGGVTLPEPETVTDPEKERKTNHP